MPKDEETTKKRELEDCEPGASKAEVFDALKKVARKPKPSSQKRGKQPDSASS